MLRKLRILWQDTAGDGVTAEPSEVRFRTWLLALAMLAGPPLLLFLYTRVMFVGLTNPDALDFAQLGRNLSAGRGFVTYILRPLALTEGGGNPMAQPDVTHGPLYPFLLALAFGAFGARDGVAMAVSGLFYLVTIPVVYRLGLRVFGRAVALLTALIFTFNALMLEYAASGLHITLYVFLATALLLMLYEVADWSRRHSADFRTPAPRTALLLAGMTAGCLYLTDLIFFWVLPVVLGFAVWLCRPRWKETLPWFVLPLAILVLPWMVRNAVTAGNPVFGLRGLELWMHTDRYPGFTAYRLMLPDLAPGVGVFRDVLKKILLGAGEVIQAFPQITASWVLAFFLPGLLFRFADPAANTLRRIVMGCFLALFVGTLIFSIQMPLFVSTIPAMLIFSVAFLLHLARQAQLSPGSTGLVIGLVAIGVGYPLLTDLAGSKPRTLAEAPAARLLGERSRPNDVALSDQPWIVAWHADRPAVWIPVSDARTAQLRERFATTRWLFLTEMVRGYSANWLRVYDTFLQWNLIYAQARASGQRAPAGIRIEGDGNHPLLQALRGFESVSPVETDLPRAVVAVLPSRPTANESRPKADGRMADAGATQRELVK